MFGNALLARLFNQTSFSVWPMEASDNVSAQLMAQADRAAGFRPAEARELREAAQVWLTVATSR
jgi:hypothetical protein